MTLVERKDAEAETTRAEALWKARRTFWFDIEGSAVIVGGRRPTLLEQLRQIRRKDH